jgi:hypothetical protein
MGRPDPCEPSFEAALLPRTQTLCCLELAPAALALRLAVVTGVREQLGAYGPAAHLVTVGPGGRPHVVSVIVEADGELLRTTAGSTTSANAAANPAVTLVWAAPPGEAYTLLVDGRAEPVDDRLVVVPTRAVRHRVVTASGDGPSCITIL